MSDPNQPDTTSHDSTGRVLHAGLHLLDHQIVTREEGRMVGNVDDLELDLTADPPVVSAILLGPQAYGPRFPGLVGRFIVTAHRRLDLEPDPQPVRILADQITDVTTAVEVENERPEAERGFGLWIREQFIERIPGSRHAAK